MKFNDVNTESDCNRAEFLVKTDETVKRRHVRRVALPLCR